MSEPPGPSTTGLLETLFIYIFSTFFCTMFKTILLYFIQSEPEQTQSEPRMTGLPPDRQCLPGYLEVTRSSLSADG